MGYLQKVEAAILKPIDIKKIEKIQPKSKKTRPPKVQPDFAEGTGKGEKVGFGELTNTKKLTPFIQKELQLTDPFNFTSDSWARFTKVVSPKLLTALLLDMNVVPKSKRAEFARYLERRLRTLSKT
jgi:hypothetical protein